MTTPNAGLEGLVGLLPCPFCGSPAMVKRNKTVMVSCTGCSASTFQQLGDSDSAITAWNTRPLPGAEGDARDAIDSFRAGAKFALRSVAKQDLCFLTDSMRTVAIKLAVEEVKAEVATMRAALASRRELGGVSEPADLIDAGHDYGIEIDVDGRL